MRSAGVNRSARESASSTSREARTSRPCFNHVYQVVPTPATLSIITSLPEGPERPERNPGPLALWGATDAPGASSGALLGGVPTQGLGWSTIFAVNVPSGAIVVALGLRAIR